MYILTIAIINKYFEFETNWLKLFVLGTIALNFVPYQYAKKMEIFQQYRNFSSEIHQNLISTN